MHSQLDRIAPSLLDKANLIVDLILVAAAIGVSLRLPGHHFMACTVMLTVAATVTWFISIAVLRLYAPWTPRTRIDSLAMGTLAAVATTGVVAGSDFIIHGGAFSVDPVRFGMILFAVENLIRISLFARLTARFPDQTGTVLIIGTGELGVETARLLAATSSTKRVLGFLHFDGEPTVVAAMKRSPVFAAAAQLDVVLRDQAVDEIYVAGRVMTQGEEMQRVVQACEAVGVPFAVPLHSLTYHRSTPFGSSATLDPYVHYSSTRSMPVQYALKRVIDIAASTLALFLLSPLLVGVALAIKLTSPGPVLFKQRRVGLHGCRFNMFKFRSMVVNAEQLQAQLLIENEQSGPVFKMKNDPRMTPIGRFIRKYSIDELPQLINILRGDMTIVGPRPAVPAEVEKYSTWQRRRLSVRPGLTCYWQVSGRNEIGFDEWMRLDLQYIDNWSLAVDVRLILRTVPVVLAGKGAS
jgi:exopolysaccharide biosynthesis polyprenyl glycosylphosphotransferase